MKPYLDMQESDAEFIQGEVVATQMNLGVKTAVRVSEVFTDIEMTAAGLHRAIKRICPMVQRIFIEAET